MFRKKPVVIEAVQWVDGEFLPEVPGWLTEAASLSRHQTGAVYPEGDFLVVRTLEGKMLASPGDWLIRGVAGELYPCKPDIFEKTYEEVGEFEEKVEELMGEEA